jgi:DNA modification methylase
MLTKSEMQTWFRSFWADIKGASTRDGHPAPYPIELAERLIRMFSFAGDTIVDPFAGTGSTAIAVIQTGRNSVSNEIDPTYAALAHRKVRRSTALPRLVGAVEAEIIAD